MLSNELKQFTPLELLLLHKHVKLGKKHLSDWLTQEEIDQLFLLAKQDQETEAEMAADTSEFVGGMSLVVNTVFTATFGAWTGISGFMKLSLNKPALFFSLLFFCTLVGAFVGFHNYQFTKRQSRNAIDQKKLKMIEMNILKTINRHRDSEIQNKLEDLKGFIKKLQITGIELLDLPPEEFDDHKVCLNWLHQTDRAVRDLEENEQFSQVFSAEIKAVQSSLEEDFDQDKKRKKKISSRAIEKLIHLSSEMPQKSNSWIRTNFRAIIISLIPMMMGGFSSLFVYIGSAPKLAEEMHQHQLYEFLSQPRVKYTELFAAVMMTLFFAYSSLHSNWKAFKRDQELKKITLLVAKEEMNLQLMDDKFLKMKQVEDVIKPISRLYTAFKKIIASKKNN